MRVAYTIGPVQFAFDATSNKEAFEQMAALQEVFCESECGKCKSKSIRYEVRTFDGKRYFKMICDDCRATLDFGQNQDLKNLFPKRFDKDTKQAKENRGWYHYEKKDHGPDHNPTFSSPSGGNPEFEKFKANLWNGGDGLPLARINMELVPWIKNLPVGEKRSQFRDHLNSVMVEHGYIFDVAKQEYAIKPSNETFF